MKYITKTEIVFGIYSVLKSFNCSLLELSKYLLSPNKSMKANMADFEKH